MPALPRITHPLSDGAVSLRPMGERDIPEILIAFEDDETLHERLGLAQPWSAAELGRQTERAEVERLAGVYLALTVTAPDDERFLGQVNIHHLDWGNLRGELGIWLAPGARGHGYSPRALRLAAEWLISAAGMARIELHTEPDNEAMLAAAAAAGFTREAVLRGYTLERGSRVDNVVFSLLPQDLGN